MKLIRRILRMIRRNNGQAPQEKETPEVTHRILDGSFKDYGAGLEIQSPGKEFISWDEPYCNLIRSPNVHAETHSFLYPVRIGNILLSNLLFSENKRNDVPALFFCIDFFERSNSEEAYLEIKNRLMHDFPEESRIISYERKEQCHYSFYADDIRFSLCRTYEKHTEYNNIAMSLSVENLREYPHLLLNPEYEENMEISGYLTIDEEMVAVCDDSEYKNDDSIKYRPKGLPQNTTPIIWMDKKNSKIGFADKKYSKIFDLSDVEHIDILNILPAKGSGGSNMGLRFRNGDFSYVFFSHCHFFDSYREKIEKLTGLSVTAGECYDC